MKEGPILFSAPMVRAIIEGRKTQTRRALRQKEIMAAGIRGIMQGTGPGFGPCPYGQPGDRLWVREAFCIRWVDHVTGKPIDADGQLRGKIGRQEILYRADFANDQGWIKACGTRQRRPSIFMPRWASRITLEIAKVRVERVQGISGTDAIAEGIVIPRCGCEVCAHSSEMCPADQSAAIMAYMELWDSINAKREGGIYAWSKNPWVWAISSRRILS